MKFGKSLNESFETGYFTHHLNAEYLSRGYINIINSINGNYCSILQRSDE